MRHVEDANEPDYTWTERTFLAAVFRGDRAASLAAIRWLPGGKSCFTAITERPLLFGACAMMLRWGGDAADAVARVYPPCNADARNMAEKAAFEFTVACLGHAASCLRGGDLLGAETHLTTAMLLPSVLRRSTADVAERLIVAVAEAEAPLARRYPALRGNRTLPLPPKEDMLGELGVNRACLGMAARLVAHAKRHDHPDLARAVLGFALRRADWPTWSTLTKLPLEALVEAGLRDAGEADKYFSP